MGFFSSTLYFLERTKWTGIVSRMFNTVTWQKLERGWMCNMPKPDFYLMGGLQVQWNFFFFFPSRLTAFITHFAIDILKQATFNQTFWKKIMGDKCPKETQDLNVVLWKRKEKDLLQDIHFCIKIQIENSEFVELCSKFSLLIFRLIWLRKKTKLKKFMYDEN